VVRYLRNPTIISVNRPSNWTLQWECRLLFERKRENLEILFNWTSGFRFQTEIEYFQHLQIFKSMQRNDFRRRTLCKKLFAQIHAMLYQCHDCNFQMSQLKSPCITAITDSLLRTSIPDWTQSQLWNLRFSLWRMSFSGMRCLVALIRTDILRGRIASIIMVVRISEPGNTLAVSREWSRLRRNAVPSLMLLHPDDGSDIFLRNVGSYKNHTPSHPRTRHSSKWLVCKSKNQVSCMTGQFDSGTCGEPLSSESLNSSTNSLLLYNHGVNKCVHKSPPAWSYSYYENASPSTYLVVQDGPQTSRLGCWPANLQCKGTARYGMLHAPRLWHHLSKWMQISYLHFKRLRQRSDLGDLDVDWSMILK
jgi:hypothetical protein